MLVGDTPGEHTGGVSSSPRRRPDAKCPLRPGEPCTLCQMGVTGPQDCGIVYLIMDDPEAREEWVKARARQSQRG